MKFTLVSRQKKKKKRKRKLKLEIVIDDDDGVCASRAPTTSSTLNALAGEEP